MTKQDLLAYGFSRPTLLTVEFSLGYLRFISVDLFLIDLVGMLATTRDLSTVTRYIYACIIKQKFKGLYLTEITSLPEIKNEMRTWHIISIIAENKTHAHHKTHLHTIKV